MHIYLDFSHEPSMNGFKFNDNPTIGDVNVQECMD